MRSRAACCAALVVSTIGLAACGGPTTPTQPPTPVPPTPDPPKMTCPAAQTAQSADGSATIVTYTTPAVVNGQAPVNTVCTPASGIAFSVGQATVNCTATDALQRTDTCSFVVTVLAPPKLAATSFLAFGDSITWGEDGQNSSSSSISIMSARLHPSVRMPQAVQYPFVLQTSLASRYKTQFPTVDNQGRTGETAADSGTLSRFAGLTASRTYGAVLILEGTNDLYDRDDRVVPYAIDGLRSMIHDAKGHGMRPYLATIPPMDPTKCVPVCRGLPWSLVSGFNDSVRTLAASEGVTLVDVYQGFGGDLSLLGPDGLHPSVEGYAKIADMFFQSIKTTLETTPAANVLTSSRRTSAR